MISHINYVIIFLIKKLTIVDDFVENITDYENWTDEYHAFIYNEVSYNGTDDKTMIINILEYAGAVFEAIKL
jgi:hypothetical protein